jgi:hypothetical protein
MKLAAVMTDGRLALRTLHVKALAGQADISGSVALDDKLNSELTFDIRDMMLDQTIRQDTVAAKNPKYGGRVNAAIVASVPLRDALRRSRVMVAGAGAEAMADDTEMPSRWGRGRIDLDHARLVHTPVVQDLGRTITKGRSLFTGETTQPTRPVDKASVVFALCGDRAQCTEITYESEIFAARGRGTIGFVDRQLDLVLNAGPLEKMQAVMGRVGSVFGKLTDAVAAYHVTGPIAKPQVQMQFAGGAIGKVGHGVENGVRGVVGGIERIGDRFARTEEN